MYKFCIISFISGTRGAFLGWQLLKNYPEYFSVEEVYKIDPDCYEEHDTWHIYKPHFGQQIFHSHPVMELENLFDTPASKCLDKTKYNIILTHLYSDEELKILYDLFSEHVVKTIQITFDKEDIPKIVDRLGAILPNYNFIMADNFVESRTNYLSTVYDRGSINPTATIAFSQLLDYKNPPDLSNLLEHFKL